MNESSAVGSHHVADAAWQEIEDLLHEISALARDAQTAEAYYSGLLERAVKAIAAQGGAVWTREQATIRPIASMRLVDLRLAGASQTQHSRLVEQAFSQSKVLLVPPHSGSNGTPGYAGEYVLLLAPVATDHGTAQVIELFVRPGQSPAVERGYVQFAETLADLAGDFERRQELRQLRDRADTWQQFEDFQERIHTRLETRSTAYAIANEGRRLVGCDRLSVLRFNGRRAELLAVSGLDTFDRRATHVQQLEALARAVALAKDPVWVTDEASELPPQIERPCHGYLSHSKSRLLGVLPLTRAVSKSKPDNRRVMGVLVAERFDSSQADPLLRQRMATAVRHSEIALTNAAEHDRGRIARGLIAIFSPRIGWLTAGLLTLAGVIAALVLIPADFEIEGRGQLYPKTRRDVFAPHAGIVTEARAQQSQRVAAGDVLLKLQSAELDYEYSRVLGERQTAEQRLATLQAARLSATPDTDINKLTAEQTEVEVQLKNLAEQQKILEKQLGELTVKSPIGGEVLTWELNRELAARPVQVGDRLMTIADLKGEWELELQVPDYHINHVYEAQRRAGNKPVPVSFLLASDPGVVHEGEIERMSVGTDIVDGDNRPAVQIRVRLKGKPTAAFRPGAAVIPSIACGRKPLGYVWFHDAIDAARIWLML